MKIRVLLFGYKLLRYELPKNAKEEKEVVPEGEDQEQTLPNLKVVTERYLGGQTDTSSSTCRSQWIYRLANLKSEFVICPAWSRKSLCYSTVKEDDEG